MTDDPYSRRRARLADLVARQNLGAVALVPGVNFLYLTGLHFHLMERPTLMFVGRDGSIAAIMPELERQKWSETFPDAQTFYWQDKDGYDAAFAAARAALGAVEVGVEGMRMRVFEGEALARHFGADAVRNAEATLLPLRLSKDAAEIAAMSEAIAISETALLETLAEVRAGQTERQIAALLKSRMLAGGADGFAFDPLVLAGPKSANPHGTPDDAPLKPGDALLIDFGAMAGGYNADITRTFFCGHVTDRHRAIYDTVLAANTHGRAVAGPGLTAHDLDTAVTGVLAASPFADMILHKTGHGLGLDVHEAPQVMVGNHAALVPGAVVTIEPGLYRAGEIGVRIEDDVVIEAGGSRSLTSLSRDLTLVG